MYLFFLLFLFFHLFILLFIYSYSNSTYELYGYLLNYMFFITVLTDIVIFLFIFETPIDFFLSEPLDLLSSRSYFYTIVFLVIFYLVFIFFIVCDFFYRKVIFLFHYGLLPNFALFLTYFFLFLSLFA